MSKAFTSEETPDDAIVVAPRAPLPPGVPNLVTARGLAQLRVELAALEAERARVQASGPGETEGPRRLAVLAARIAALAERLATAELVAPPEPTTGVVRFGATVTVRTLSGAAEGEERRFEIVGVDEADPAEGRVAFTSPIARALIGRAPGDETVVELPKGQESLEIVRVEHARTPS